MDAPETSTQTGSMAELPTHPLSATLNRTGSHRSLALERHLPFPAAEIWHALTDREVVPQWAPFAPDRDLDATGEVVFAQPEGESNVTTPAQVLTASYQQMLSLLWTGDRIDIELASTAHDTILRLDAVLSDADVAPASAAGWHLAIEMLHARLASAPSPMTMGDPAYAQRWDVLFERYSEIFGEKLER